MTNYKFVVFNFSTNIFQTSFTGLSFNQDLYYVYFIDNIPLKSRTVVSLKKIIDEK